jgi:hypothetical protein
MRVFVFSCIFFFFSVQGFAQTDDYSIHSTENKMLQHGSVVGTITVAKNMMRRSKYTLVFRNSKNKFDKTTITLKLKNTNRKKPHPDFWDGDKAVYVVVWKRDTGSYYFSDVAVKIPANNFEEALHYAFNVSENELTYFGNIEIDATQKKVTLNKDKRKRDLYLVLQKYPHSFWNKYHNGSIILNAEKP